MIDNPQDESILEFLRKIDSMVDSIVVVDFKSTTTTISTTARKKLMKLFLNNPSRKILKTIIELEAFTSFTLQSLLSLTKHQVYPTLRFLDEVGLIKKRATIKTAPRTSVFLLNGANDSRLMGAIDQHFDLMPSGIVKMLECYMDPHILESLILRIEDSRFNTSVRRVEIFAFAKELTDDFDYSLIQATMNHFKDKGWEVVY